MMDKSILFFSFIFLSLLFFYLKGDEEILVLTWSNPVLENITKLWLTKHPRKGYPTARLQYVWELENYTNEGLIT